MNEFHLKLASWTSLIIGNSLSGANTGFSIGSSLPIEFSSNPIDAFKLTFSRRDIII